MTSDPTSAPALLEGFLVWFRRCSQQNHAGHEGKYVTFTGCWELSIMENILGKIMGTIKLRGIIVSIEWEYHGNISHKSSWLLKPQPNSILTCLIGIGFAAASRVCLKIWMGYAGYAPKWPFSTWKTMIGYPGCFLKEPIFRQTQMGNNSGILVSRTVSCTPLRIDGDGGCSGTEFSRRRGNQKIFHNKGPYVANQSHPCSCAFSSTVMIVFPLVNPSTGNQRGELVLFCQGSLSCKSQYSFRTTSFDEWVVHDGLLDVVSIWWTCHWSCHSSLFVALSEYFDSSSRSSLPFAYIPVLASARN
jgi:hypothetical protein